MTTPVLLTGANGGVGVAVARNLLKKSELLVYVATRDAAKGAALVKELDSTRAVPIELDVESDRSVLAAVDSVKGDLQKRGLSNALAGLLNNAAVCLEYVQGWDVEGAAYDPAATRAHYSKSLSINSVGAAVVAEAFLPLLRAWKDHSGQLGVLINVSTNLGSLGLLASYPQARAIRHPSYGMSKAALNQLTVYLAKREEGHVRVVSIAPGPMKTNLNGFHPLGADPQEGSIILAEELLKHDGETCVFISKDGKMEW